MATASKQRPRRQKSLQARALAYLARREQSRAELARKLGPHAASAAELDALLDDLERRKLLSEARFIEALTRSRSQRFGAARVGQELRRHGVSAEALRGTVAALRESEFARARALWQRRYGAVAADAAERARQARFLAGRGFGGEIIRKVIAGADEDE